jgi:hypothetical protein
MLLADLSYAQETAAGSDQVAFLTQMIPRVSWANEIVNTGNTSSLNIIPKKVLEEPVTHSWGELFQILLSED